MIKMEENKILLWCYVKSPPSILFYIDRKKLITHEETNLKKREAAIKRWKSSIYKSKHLKKYLKYFRYEKAFAQMNNSFYP